MIARSARFRPDLAGKRSRTAIMLPAGPAAQAYSPDSAVTRPEPIASTSCW